MVLVIAVAAAIAVVPVAAAQDPITDPSAAQYDPPIPDPGETGSSGASGADGASGSAGGTGSAGASGLNANIGSLPFTGMDLLIVAGVAFVLTGTGFALRRLSTPRGPFV